MENKANIDSKFSKIYLSKRASKMYPKACLLYKNKKYIYVTFLPPTIQRAKRYLSTIYKDKEQKLQNNKKGSN